MKTFENLQYGDIVIAVCYRLRNFGFVAFTSSDDEGKKIECKVEKYWEDDVCPQTSYKIKLVPLDSNYSTESYYVMDFKNLIDKTIFLNF